MQRLVAVVIAMMAMTAEAGEMRELVWIGFQNQDGVSRVFVKTNEQVQYKVSEGKDSTLVIDLFDTRAQSKNHKRPMDTSEFDSPVLKVSVEEREGAAGKTTRVEIKLRNMAPYEVKQTNEVLSVEVKR